ncbi:MAG: ATP-grasp domain-containing protein [bacterium]
MKKVNWIIEKYLFSEYEDKLVDTIKESGMNVSVFDDSMSRYDNMEDFANNKFSEDSIVIMHGSLQSGRRMLRTSRYPGIFLTLENYECYNYYGYFGDHLLNSDYVMMGLNDLSRKKRRLFEYFYPTNKLFIRPSNGYKSFTGQLLSEENFEQELDILTKSYGGLDMNTLVVLSPSRSIEEEYRFVVIGDNVVSGALYMDKESRKYWKPYYDKICEDDKAFEFAEKMSKLYQPDKAYTIDVCRLSNGEYKMIELNSFCCASWYGNDYNKIVESVNNLCIEEYNDVYGY